MNQPPYKGYQAKRADQECKRQERLRKTPWHWFGQSDAVARFTLYVGFFTLALVGVGFLQWCTLGHQLNEMHQAGIDAENTKRLDERAWVGVEEMSSIPPVPQTDKPWDVSLTFRNSGKTPAINFLMQSSQHIQAEFPNINSKCAEAIKKRDSVTMLPPNGRSEAILHITDGAPSNWEDQITAGNALYVWGCVVYDDVFTGRHWMTYCGNFKPVTKGGQITFQSCKIGNNTGDGDPPK